jgi:cAMP phosphodiesterase
MARGSYLERAGASREEWHSQVKVTLVQSSVGTGKRHQVLASYIVNDIVSLDAGCIGFVSPLETQKKIQHVFLSHSHIDHTASLPIFVDIVYEPTPDCVTVWGNESVLEGLQTDVFNDRVWPDMIRLSGEETPFLKMELLEANKPVEIGDLKVTAIPLDHVVPTFGFLVQETGASFILVSDTSPTHEIWEIANSLPDLKAVFLEASFPNSFQWLAEKAAHLTPNLFKSEVAKLKQDVPIIAIHIKPAFEEQVIQELHELGIPNLEIGVPGKTYEF